MRWFYNSFKYYNGSTCIFYYMNGDCHSAFLPLTAYICHMKILMVCLGNICRSPLAEGILKDKITKAQLDWEVDSAGTNGFHVGEQPHPLSQKVAKLKGINVSNQRCRCFVKEDFDRFDIIYAMAADIIDEMKWIGKDKYNERIVKLLLNEVSPGKNKDVPDPWFGTEPGYHQVYDLMETACEAIIKNHTR